jgi:hypothetical protein
LRLRDGKPVPYGGKEALRLRDGKPAPYGGKEALRLRDGKPVPYGGKEALRLRDGNPVPYGGKEALRLRDGKEALRLRDGKPVPYDAGTSPRQTGILVIGFRQLSSCSRAQCAPCPRIVPVWRTLCAATTWLLRQTDNKNGVLCGGTGFSAGFSVFAVSENVFAVLEKGSVFSGGIFPGAGIISYHILTF